MIDWVKILVRPFDFVLFKKQTGIEFSTSINTETGEQNGRRHRNNSENFTCTYTSHFEYYNLKVLEIHRCTNGLWIITHNLIIAGSLHKNHFGGANYRRFTFYHLMEQIHYLCDSLFLSPEDCIIQNIEIGLNFVTPFEVAPFISDCVLMHSIQPFVDYEPGDDGLSLGRYAKHSQHSVKLYNKGLQCSLGYPLARFEERCTKMQYLAKYHVHTLADLLYYEKVRALSKIVLKVWDQTLICNTAINPSMLSIPQSQRELLHDGCNRDYWVRLYKQSTSLFNKRRARFRHLTRTYSEVDQHMLVKELIVKELADIFKEGTLLPDGGIPPQIKVGNTLTNLINHKSVPNPLETLPVIQPVKFIHKEAGDVSNFQVFPNHSEILFGQDNQSVSCHPKRSETSTTVVPIHQPQHTTTPETKDGRETPDASGSVKWQAPSPSRPVTENLDQPITRDGIGISKPMVSNEGSEASLVYHTTSLKDVEKECIPSERVNRSESLMVVNVISSEAQEARVALNKPKSNRLLALTKLCAGLIKAIRIKLKPP